MLKRLGHGLLLGIALLGVLLEATLWRWLTRLGEAIARIPLFAALERLVQRLSPNAVAAVFVLPFVPLVPLLKLLEVWLIGHRHFVWAALLILGGKVVGVAFSTRVFAIARPKLMQLRWFAWSYGKLTALLALGHDLLDEWPAWVRLRAVMRRWRAALHALRLRLFPPGGGPLRRQLAAAMRRWRGRRAL